MTSGAASKNLNVAIAGAGPAGLAAAVLLRRAGHDVTLFERFETPRPVGSGLMIQPTGLAVLDHLGLGEAMRAHASVIDRLLGKAAETGKTVLDVRYQAIGAARGFGVHRASLFQLLFDAAKDEEVRIVTGRMVTGCELAADGRRLMFTDGESAGPFDLVVDALGFASPLAPPTGCALAYGALWATVDWPDGAELDRSALEQRYLRASRMVGVLLIGRPPGASRLQANFFWSLRADHLEDWRGAGLSRWKDGVLALWPETAPVLDQITSADQLIFARYAHRTLRRPIAPGLVHIGDAWRSSSPQLGQGANMALLDAYALALAVGSEADLGAALARFHRLRRDHVRLYQWMSWAFTPVYQSDSRLLPWLRDQVAGPLSKTWPASAILALMVGGILGGPLGRLGLKGRLGATRRDPPPGLRPYSAQRGRGIAFELGVCCVRRRMRF